MCTHQIDTNTPASTTTISNHNITHTLTCLHKLSHIRINQRHPSCARFPPLNQLLIPPPGLGYLPRTTDLKHLVTVFLAIKLEIVAPDELKSQPVSALIDGVSLSLISLRCIVYRPVRSCV